MQPIPSRNCERTDTLTRHCKETLRTELLVATGDLPATRIKSSRGRQLQNIYRRQQQCPAKNEGYHGDRAGTYPEIRTYSSHGSNSRSSGLLNFCSEERTLLRHPCVLRLRDEFP